MRRKGRENGVGWLGEGGTDRPSLCSPVALSLLICDSQRTNGGDNQSLRDAEGCSEWGAHGFCWVLLLQSDWRVQEFRFLNNLDS